MNTNAPQVLPAPDSAPKLTNWKKEPTVQDLKYDLEQAKPGHNAFCAKVQEWNDLRTATGSAKPPKIKGRSSVQPKLIQRQAEWRYSALSEPFLGSDKLFKISPRTWEDEEGARQNELLLNYQFKEQMNLVKFVDNYIRSLVDDGTVIVQVGWERQTQRVTENLPQFEHYEITEQEDMDKLQRAIQLKTENPRGYNEKLPDDLKAAVEFYLENEIPTVARVTGYVPTPVDKVICNKPVIEVLDPQNVIPDPSCNGDLAKAKFVVVSFETSKADLLKDKSKKYKNLDKINWEDAVPVTTPDHKTATPTGFQFKDPSRKRIVAYDYWGFYDIAGNGQLEPIVATWVGGTMIRMERNPFPDRKLPFVLVQYSPVKRELYGTPDAELLKDNQAISGALYRGMVDSFGRSANSQTGTAKGALDPMNKRKFEAGLDYEFNPGANPEATIYQHKYPEIPVSAFNMLTLQNQEAEGLSGVKAFSGGLSGNAYGDVAAGIRGMLDASAKREMAILRRAAQGMSEIGTKVIGMNSEWLTEKEVVRITNDEFVEVYREDLPGNYDTKVDIATAEVDNAKSQDLAFLLQTMGPNMDFGITKVVMAEIAELKRMPRLAHILKNFKKEPSPQEQELMQLEMEERRMNVEKLKSEIALNQARAQQAMATAGKTAVDTKDQLTGTTHARNIEQQQAQARGNQALEVTKALTKPRKEGESNPDIDAAVGFNQLSDTLATGGLMSPITSAQERDQISQADPRFSLGSSNFDPSLDPSLNPAINL